MVVHPVKEIPVEDRRKFSRLHTMLNAQFFFEPQRGWQKCSIFNVSCKGFAIQFHADDVADRGAPIYLEVYNTDCSEAMHFRGVLRWIEKMDNSYIAGIELLRELDEQILTKLL